MIKLMLITNNIEIGKFAVQCGVNRIFVDLEKLGKKERQGHLNTLISEHSITDVQRMRLALPHTELLVRLNPLHEHTAVEIDDAIHAGADLLMLPMFKTAEEINLFCQMVAGRVKVVPLLETPQAMNALSEWAHVPGISEIYIGLNDLSLSFGMDFMFQPLANGMVDNMANIIKNAGLPFGFGGIARLGEGMLLPEKILIEHVRLGSSSVILSRTFHRSSQSLEELNAGLDLQFEISKLRQYEQKIQNFSHAAMERNRELVHHKVNEIIQSIRSNRMIKTNQSIKNTNHDTCS